MRVADRFDLLSVLGEGGMAIVYEAHDSLIHRRVALKILQKKEPAATARFEREARAASALHHPAVVKVFGIGSLPNGQPYIALEFIEGETLIEAIERDGPMAPERALALIMPVVGALAEAHAAGIVHRDIKPSNLIVQRAAGQFESLRLLDFGIASMGELDGRRLTRTGEVFGTPEFMAPEQAMGKTVGPPADIWALGAVLYEVLTGRPPFTGTHAPGILYKVVNEPLPPLDPFIPEELAELVEECLAKSPKHRPADGAALLARMESLLLPAQRQLASSRPPAGVPVEVEVPARPTMPPTRTPRPARTRWWISGLIMVAALSIACIWWVLRQAHEARVFDAPDTTTGAQTTGAQTPSDQTTAAQITAAATPKTMTPAAPVTAAPVSVAPATAAPVTTAPATTASRVGAAVVESTPADPSPDAGVDQGPTDAGPVDARVQDAAPVDQGEKDAAPPDAEPAKTPPSKKPKPSSNSLPAKVVSQSVQAPRDALRWLRRNRGKGDASERDAVELRARLTLRDMGRSAKILKRIIKTHPDAVEPARAELMAALGTSKYWDNLVAPLAHPKLFPRVESELMRLTRSGNAAGRWRALKVIQKAKGNWREARSNVIIRELKNASHCTDRKKHIRELGRLGQPVSLGPIKAQRDTAKGFSNLCMGSTIEDALDAIRQARRRRR
jgi:serine/threonine-protein kinase